MRKKDLMQFLILLAAMVLAVIVGMAIKKKRRDAPMRRAELELIHHVEMVRPMVDMSNRGSNWAIAYEYNLRTGIGGALEDTNFSGWAVEREFNGTNTCTYLRHTRSNGTSRRRTVTEQELKEFYSLLDLSIELFMDFPTNRPDLSFGPKNMPIQ